MKGPGFGFSLLLIAPVLFTATSAFAQTASDGVGRPAVVKAVAPQAYPAIAMSARAGGSVIIKVTINQKGEVTATKLVSGHLLLESSSQAAARRWLFAVAERDVERFVELEFIYTPAAKAEEAGVFFMPPYKVEIISFPPTIDITNKNNGRPRN